MAKQKCEGANVVLPGQTFAAQLYLFLWTRLKYLEDCGCFRFCLWLYVSHFAKWCKLRGSYFFNSELPSSNSKCMQTKSSHYVTAACCDSHWLQRRPAASHLWAEGEAESKRQPELKPCRGRTDGEKLAWWLESAIMASIRRERNWKSSVERVSIDLCPYVCDGRGQREQRENII